MFCLLVHSDFTTEDSRMPRKSADLKSEGTTQKPASQKPSFFKDKHVLLLILASVGGTVILMMTIILIISCTRRHQPNSQTAQAKGYQPVSTEDPSANMEPENGGVMRRLSNFLAGDAPNSNNNSTGDWSKMAPVSTAEPLRPYQPPNSLYASDDEDVENVSVVSSDASPA